MLENNIGNLYFEETIFVGSYLGRMCNKYADKKERAQVCKHAS